MLRIRLICVGRLGEPFWAQAAREYQKRLGAYCRLELLELPEQTRCSQAEALRKEAALIEAKIPARSVVAALCVEGKPLSSEAFAAWLEKISLSGTSQICFLIGGSEGLAESVKQRADIQLSMSSMTFPHTLARIMALEQLYRAFNMLAGGKYHK